MSEEKILKELETTRSNPYGIALINHQSIADFNNETGDNVVKSLNNKGVLVLEIEHEEIPPFLFSITQKATGFIID